MEFRPQRPNSYYMTYAVGRYAYAVYDEGGLLDINVAGYPTSTGPSPTVTDIGRKGGSRVRRSYRSTNLRTSNLPPGQLPEAGRH